MDLSQAFVFPTLEITLYLGKVIVIPAQLFLPTADWASSLGGFLIDGDDDHGCVDGVMVAGAEDFEVVGLAFAE
jgi:hypothetical protein